MPRRNIPHVNASLIREARMIYQQLFGAGRVDNYYAMRAAEAQAKAQQIPPLKCGKCMEVGSRAKDAVVIYNGMSLCQPHANIAMAPSNRDSGTFK